MAKTFLELIEQVKGILRVVNGGTGLTTSGSDASKVLKSDGAGGFVMGSAGGGSIPLVIQSGELWSIAARTQGNYITEVEIQSGGEVVIASGAELVQGVVA